MKTQNKETHTCDCGHVHTISKRKISISSTMVRGLAIAYDYCKNRGDWHFTRKEIKHLFGGDETLTATFGDLIYFGGILFKPDGKRGHWGINFDRAELFLNNRATVAKYVIKDPVTKEVTPSETRVLMKQVKGVASMLDDEGEFVVEYR